MRIDHSLTKEFIHKDKAAAGQFPALDFLTGNFLGLPGV